MSAATSYLDDTVASLTTVVAQGAPTLVPGSSKAAVRLIDTIEQARRLTSVALVDVLTEIETTRCFYDHGHANARVMFQHVAGVSGSEAHRLDQIRRMIGAADLIAAAWRTGALSVDKAALLGRAYANPRTRDRFQLDQKWFIKQARRFNMVRLTKIVAKWIEVHDQNGPDPDPDPSFERRRASLSQDHFSKAWKLDAELGSLQGSTFNQTFRAYVQAAFAHDWAQAEAIHGPDTSLELLARTHQQRCADALCQIAADAANSDKPSAPVKRVHNIVWTAEVYEDLLRRWVGGSAAILDPDSYNITDIDGHPLAAGDAFADSLVSSLRRVVQNAAGVTINMGTTARLFEGLARLGVILTTTECYWPGCHVPTSRCHIDHLKPAARGGPTNQLNGLPACCRHNYLKESGYTVSRQADGTIQITTPTGDIIQ